ncbi:MAG: hypothetical protein OXD36_15195, partial [Rhodobacter sp.]|nr:hypothetical protein [Rhodobacter sp.]
IPIELVSAVYDRFLGACEPESKLFNYLSALPKLEAYALEYGKIYRGKESFDDRWVMGNGFQPVNEERLGEESYRTYYSEIVPNVPYLPIEEFRTLAQDRERLQPFNDGHKGMVRRKGFERGFTGPRVLVPAESELAARDSAQHTWKHPSRSKTYCLRFRHRLEKPRAQSC